MPKISFQDQVIECEQNANLRRSMIDAGVPLYNSIAGAIHCRGLGTCGTCAVEVTGPVSALTAIEKWRLSFPPHRSDSGLRLACQCRVLGDVQVRKWPGLWGNKIAERDEEQ